MPLLISCVTLNALNPIETLSPFFISNNFSFGYSNLTIFTLFLSKYDVCPSTVRYTIDLLSSFLSIKLTVRFFTYISPPSTVFGRSVGFAIGVGFGVRIGSSLSSLTFFTRIIYFIILFPFFTSILHLPSLKAFYFSLLSYLCNLFYCCT